MSNEPRHPAPVEGVAGAAGEPETRLGKKLKSPEDEDATQLGPPFSVAVIDGPDRGKRRKIRGARMVVGRGEACDLRLTDGSVSRRHLELVLGVGGLVVRDLGSNNGTLVNGAKVPEAQVHHRDTVGLGATVLTVIDEFKELKEAREVEEREREARRAKAEAPPAPPATLALGEVLRRYRAAAGACAVAAALVAGAGVTCLRRPPPPPSPAVKAEPTPAPTELRAVEALLAAHRFAQAGDLEKAIAAASQVEAESSRLEEAKGLAANWTLALEAQRRERFKAALEAGELEPARALVPALRADEREAALAQIEASGRQREARKVEEEKLAARRDAERRQVDVRRVRDLVDQVLAGVVRKMDVGNFRGAQGELERVAEAGPPPETASKIQMLREKLPLFAQSYSDGAAKYDAGDFIDAAGPLLRSLVLYEDMDLAGKLDASLRERTARSLAARGREAFVHQDWLAAEKDYRAALRISPGLEEATHGLAELSRGR